jgi:hypothetical protein
MPKPLKLLALLGCLALAVLGGLLPGVGWLLLVLAFHILVSEFETGRDWVKGARRAGRSCRVSLPRRAATPGRPAGCIASTTSQTPRNSG